MAFALPCETVETLLSVRAEMGLYGEGSAATALAHGHCIWDAEIILTGGTQLRLLPGALMRAAAAGALTPAACSPAGNLVSAMIQ